jgi:hypothetical protein
MYLHVSCMYHVGMCTGLLAQLAERRAEPCRAAHNSKVLGSNQTFYTKHITCLSCHWLFEMKPMLQECDALHTDMKQECDSLHTDIC